MKNELPQELGSSSWFYDFTGIKIKDMFSEKFSSVLGEPKAEPILQH